MFGLSGTVVQVILPISGQVEASLANGSISNAGIAHPLEALLRQSSAAIVRGKDNAARATLGAFIRLVRGQSGKGIDAAAAQVLIDSAQEANDALTV